MVNDDNIIYIEGNSDLFVAFKDSMGSDADIVEAARVSYNNDEKKAYSPDLIDYLMRHRHSSPFEMVEFKFIVSMPIYIARQWYRHRTAHWSSFNEVSARYTEIKDKFYNPVSTVGTVENDIHKKCYEAYQEYLDNGISREDARSILPLSTITRFVWKIDLSNLLHFVALRIDPTAQPLMRKYAEALAVFVQKVAPDTYKAFEKHVLNALSFTEEEMYYLFENVDLEKVYNALAKGKSASKCKEIEMKLYKIRNIRRI